MLLEYTPNEDEFIIAGGVAIIRGRNNRSQSNLPGGIVSSENERYIIDIRGALAEIAMTRLLNVCWSGLGVGPQGVPDVGYFLEVRSIDDLDRHLLVRPKDKDSRPICLVYVDPKTRLCRFLGWAYVANAKIEGKPLDPESDRPAWLLPQSKLNDMESLMRLRDYFNKENGYARP